MDAHALLTFALATVVLVLIPGPNVALTVANSVTYGVRCGLLTVAGTGTAAVVQLALVALGMTEALGGLGSWFGWVRWLGVAHLVYLGIQQWRATPIDLTRTAPRPKSDRAIYARAFLYSVDEPEDAAVLRRLLPAIH